MSEKRYIEIDIQPKRDTPLRPEDILKMTLEEALDMTRGSSLVDSARTWGKEPANSAFKARKNTAAYIQRIEKGTDG